MKRILALFLPVLLLFAAQVRAIEPNEKAARVALVPLTEVSPFQ